MTTPVELRPLVVAAIVSIVGVCAALGTLWSVGRIESSAVEISENAALSVMALSRAEAEIHELSAELDEVIADAGGRREIAKVRARAAWARLNDALDAYYALPLFPGEKDRWPDVRAATDELERLTLTVFAEPAASSVFEALAQSRQLDQVAANLAHALTRLIDFNAGQLNRLRSDIALIRTKLLPTAAGLALLCALASTCAVIIGIRMATQTREIDAKHRQALEVRAAELEAFAGRIAHDLLSPLMTVSLALGRAHPADDRSAAVIARGVSSLQRARRLVEGLFEFARAGATAQPGAHADVHEIVDDVRSGFADVATDAGVTLRAEAPPGIFVATSSGVLTSIVSNLIQNAIRFIGDREAKEVTVRARDAGSEVRIEVEDTGLGVPPDRQAIIFEPFKQLDPKTRETMGLGLATVKRLTEAHGGRVGVDSTPNVGSILWVTLPKAGAAPSIGESAVPKR